MHALPAAPAPAPQRQMLVGTSLAVMAMVMLTGSMLAVWALQLAVSPIWLRHYRFGPLEWLWRSLTYLEFQPMRRGA